MALSGRVQRHEIMGMKARQALNVGERGPLCLLEILQYHTGRCHPKGSVLTAKAIKRACTEMLR